MQDSKIEWTHHTFNPWIGCTKISAGCKNCYAEADMDKRRGRAKWGVNGTRSVTSYAYWRKVLSWNREAKAAGERRRVFCASLADVFEDWEGQVMDSNGVPLIWPQYKSFDEFEGRNDLLEGTVFNDLKGNLRFPCSDCDGIPTFSHCTPAYIDQRYDHDYGDPRLNENSRHQKTFFRPLTIDTIRLWLFKLIEKTDGLDWLLLTKRPENIMAKIPEHWRTKFPANVWIGTSIENQEAADTRIPQLLQVPAAVRFLSCEPLLSPLRLTLSVDHGAAYRNVLSGVQQNGPLDDFVKLSELPHIHWVIAGGESGLHARPMHPDWARGLRDQCQAAGVPFLFKQWGEYAPFEETAHAPFYRSSRTGEEYDAHSLNMLDAETGEPGKWAGGTWMDLMDALIYCQEEDSSECMFLKVGKKAAGRMLDGREWNEFPVA